MPAKIPNDPGHCEAPRALLDCVAMDDETNQPAPTHHDARTRLVWELLLFQAKLAAEGIRDLFLSPISIVAVILGLVAGGEKPDVYFRRLQRFGRRSDLWINVFGERRRGPTADAMVRPLEESLLAHTKPGGKLGRGVGQVNQLLDVVNRQSGAPKPPDESR